MKDNFTILYVAGYVVYREGEFIGGNVFTVVFNFRTEMRNGVIFFAHGGSNVYFLIQLVNGSLHVEFCDGTEISKMIYNNTNYVTTCDGKWHGVNILKNNQRLAMKLDDVAETIVRSAKPTTATVLTGLDIESALYIGGIKPGSKAEHFIKKFDIPIQGSMLHL